MPSDPAYPQGERPAGSLENLERRLYSRTPPPLRHDEEGMGSERHIRIAPGWAEEAERKESALYGIFATIMPWLKRLFIASVLFVLFAGGVVFYGFWRGGSIVSPKNISVSVLGPVMAPAGEELSFEVGVANYNELALEAVDLIVDYPDGTRKPDDTSSPLLRHHEELGSLAAGESLSRKLALVPFGEEGEKKQVRITVEYRPEGSSGVFPQSALYEFTISSAPISVSFDAPREVNSGTEFDIAVEIVSNASSVVERLLVKADYPPGFQFIESEPPASFSKNSWRLGDLRPEGRRTIRLRGRLDAALESERTFRFSVGTEHPKDEQKLGAVFFTLAHSVTVARPFVELELSLNGERGSSFVAQSGQTIRADVLWRNNLMVKITDLELTAKLDGDLYQPQSVATLSGTYDSGSATVVWDKRRKPKFAAVEPGDEGSESFSFTLLPLATDPGRYPDPRMKMHVFARGKRQDEVGAVQGVVSSLSKEIRVASTLQLLSRLFYSGGDFTNQGPLPPRAGEATTYTVVWSLSNSLSDVVGAEVRATLPSYVSWLDRASPASESVTYSGVGGEVVWRAGELPSGVGIGSSPREVSFQVSALPSESHVGASPVVIGEAKASGEDRFAGVTVTSPVRPALTTGSLSDAGAGKESGKVVK